LLLALPFCLCSHTAPEKPVDLAALLPSLEGWSLSEAVQNYLPDTLFEYIDGAAESYLAYNFQGLVVGQYKKTGAPSRELTVEIYDLGSPRNAFGIYSTERYPESQFFQLGVQGYKEEGALNFFAGDYYVKLMAYGHGSAEEPVLFQAARSIAAKIPGPADFPPLLAAFPRQNRVANSERFILKNFLGMGFLEAGYTARYRLEAAEFEGFIIEAGSADRTKAMRRQLLEKSGLAATDESAGQPRVAWKDKYLGNVFIDERGSYLFGLIKVPDGQEGTAKSFMDDLARALGAFPK
jgi:hypothetical protein